MLDKQTKAAEAKIINAFLHKEVTQEQIRLMGGDSRINERALGNLIDAGVAVTLSKKEQRYLINNKQ
jgi:hypothetical protein